MKTLAISKNPPIVFAELFDLGLALAGVFSETQRRCVIVSNPKVCGLGYVDKAHKSLKLARWKSCYIEIPDGEEMKTTATYFSLVEGLLAKANVDRHTVLIAIGGGVTLDICGFAAATTLRGLSWVSVPTTLLAMVDAGVGGKTGVNTEHGKNLLGAFWQPSLVFVPGKALPTLPMKERQSGMGEILKHALIDQGFYQWLRQNIHALRSFSEGALIHAVHESCRIKAEIVAEDERESGRRIVLNLGHTIAHAIETTLGYGMIPHGVAVGIGLVREAELSERIGIARSGVAYEIRTVLQALGMPTSVDVSREALCSAILWDKKRLGEHVRVPLVQEVGKIVVETILLSELIKII